VVLCSARSSRCLRSCVLSFAHGLLAFSIAPSVPVSTANSGGAALGGWEFKYESSERRDVYQLNLRVYADNGGAPGLELRKSVRKVYCEGGFMATLRPLTLFPLFGSSGAGSLPVALDAPHVSHGSRSDDQASHAEQATHG